MAKRRTCEACGDPIEEDWWMRVEYMMEAGQMAKASRYCEDCGRELILGRLESPRSEQQRWFRAASDRDQNDSGSSHPWQDD